MWRIMLLVAVATMLAAMTVAASAAFGQAETDQFMNTGEFAFTVENPCTGEEILFEGRYRNPIHVTLNDNGYHTVTRGTVIDATGTGSETGDEYRLINPGGLSQSLKSGDKGGGLMVNNDEGLLMVVSEGASPNFLIHFLYKVTYDTADGQPGLVFQADTLGCTHEVETTRPPIV